MLYFSDCPALVNEMLTVNFASPAQYNTIGELVCNNGGALFSNNISVSNETTRNATAQWSLIDGV